MLRAKHSWGGRHRGRVSTGRVLGTPRVTPEPPIPCVSAPFPTSWSSSAGGPSDPARWRCWGGKGQGGRFGFPLTRECKTAPFGEPSYENSCPKYKKSRAKSRIGAPIQNHLSWRSLGDSTGTAPRAGLQLLQRSLVILQNLKKKIKKPHALKLKISIEFCVDEPSSSSPTNSQLWNFN